LTCRKIDCVDSFESAIFANYRTKPFRRSWEDQAHSFEFWEIVWLVVLSVIWIPSWVVDHFENFEKIAYPYLSSYKVSSSRVKLAVVHYLFWLFLHNVGVVTKLFAELVIIPSAAIATSRIYWPEMVIPTSPLGPIHIPKSVNFVQGFTSGTLVFVWS
jgi:fatty acid desaturase